MISAPVTLWEEWKSVGPLPYNGAIVKIIDPEEEGGEPAHPTHGNRA